MSGKVDLLLYKNGKPRLVPVSADLDPLGLAAAMRKELTALKFSEYHGETWMAYSGIGNSGLEVVIAGVGEDGELENATTAMLKEWRAKTMAEAGLKAK